MVKKKGFSLFQKSEELFRLTGLAVLTFMLPIENFELIFVQLLASFTSDKTENLCRTGRPDIVNEVQKACSRQTQRSLKSNLERNL